ncbi:reverse transcriptase domain-containing protein [uncultured Arcticibacterium sp.]|uniref:reverse transcriptase domain-containing protein n=1 Tax=uncultured Arcticibacterium sp. TaxID=2173042 RepID=UPI0030FB46F8
MKLDPIHIKGIKDGFAKMQSREDLLDLLNLAKPFVYGTKSVPFELKQLTWYANPKHGGKRYSEFKIKKKSGGERSIHTPVNGLKSLQSTLSFVLQCVFDPHKGAMGFVRDKSIVDNAKLHVGSRYVYNIDLKDFFSAIDQARVWKCLQLKPFNLIDVATSFKEQTPKRKTGIRKYITEKGEQIFYKIEGNSLFFVDDKKGNYKKYKERLTAHLIRPETNILQYFFNKDKEKLSAAQAKLREYTRLVDEIILEDVNRCVGTSANLKEINRLVISRLSLANMIASICCTDMEVERKSAEGEWIKVKRNVLPQGAPTSPVLTNVICQRLDYLLSAVAKRFGLKYSRYADDITFSSMHNVYQKEGDFLKELHRIIAEQGFHIKESKTRLQKDGYRKEVTGLLVNENVNVQKRYIKQIRLWLYYWERYGYGRAYGFFLEQYLKDKEAARKGRPEMTSIISGKLDYLKMVKGGENALYLKLKERFDVLVGTKVEEKTTIGTYDIDLNETEISGEMENGIIVYINPKGSQKGDVKLKRKIIIDKGKSLPHEEFLDNHEGKQAEIDLSKHKPIDVTRFLLSFRSSEGLKFLTHDYDKADSVFNYLTVLDIAKKEFNQLSSQFVIPGRLYKRIEQFAFGDPSKKWWFNKVQYNLNWRSPELLSWLKVNPNTHPIKSENFETSFITPFKKSIEIKAPELEYIFKNKLAENLASKYLSFDIELINLNKASFYTNVDALQVGISYIFKAIKQRFDNGNKIKVEFQRKADAEGRKRIIKIVHVGSECNKPLEKNELFQGDLLEAEKAFFGICDWSIISKSTDNSINKINILFDINSDRIVKEKIDDSLIEGFTHVLTFYA